jgi:hypothetical protein
MRFGRVATRARVKVSKRALNSTYSPVFPVFPVFPVSIEKRRAKRFGLRRSDHFQTTFSEPEEPTHTGILDVFELLWASSQRNVSLELLARARVATYAQSLRLRTVHG